MRWHYRDPLLAWLLPGAYALHILEEWIGGFPEWLARVAGGSLPRPAFVAINLVTLLLMLAATRASIADEKRGWLSTGVATVLFVNALAHILGSLVTSSYSPGLLTSVVLYLPLSQLTLLRSWYQSERPLFIRGIVAGIAAHAAVSLLALALAAGAR